MLCKDPNPILFGADNLLSQQGFSDCAVRWFEFVMMMCTAATIVFVLVFATYQMSRWVEWIYLKLQTRRMREQLSSDGAATVTDTDWWD